MLVRWPLKERRGEIRLLMNESTLTATCTDKSLGWLMQLNVQPRAQLPFREIASRSLTASQRGFPYRLTLRRGTFEDMRQLMGCAFRIHPEKGRVEMDMASSRAPGRREENRLRIDSGID